MGMDAKIIDSLDQEYKWSAQLRQSVEMSLDAVAQRASDSVQRHRLLLNAFPRLVHMLGHAQIAELYVRACQVNSDKSATATSALMEVILRSCRNDATRTAASKALIELAIAMPNGQNRDMLLKAVRDSNRGGRAAARALGALVKAAPTAENRDALIKAAGD